MMMRINRWQRLKWTIPLILFITTILDASLPAIFPVPFLGQNQVVISHVTLYFMITFAFYFRDNNMFLYSFLFGLFHDSFNSSILGLYATIYFLICYLIIRIKKFFPKKVFVHFMLFIVAISIQDFLVYMFYFNLSMTTVNFTEFLVTRLGPTLIFNVVVSILLYFPTKALLRWLGYESYIIF